MEYLRNIKIYQRKSRMLVIKKKGMIFRLRISVGNQRYVAFEEYTYGITNENLELKMSDSVEAIKIKIYKHTANGLPN